MQHNYSIKIILKYHQLFLQVARLYIRCDSMYILQVEALQEQALIDQETMIGHNGTKLLVQ